MKQETFDKKVREIFPDATEDDLGYLMWNHTSFPFGRPGNSNHKSNSAHYLNQLRRCAEAHDKGKIVCTHCGKMRLAHSERMYDLCKKCGEAFL